MPIYQTHRGRAITRARHVAGHQLWRTIASVLVMVCSAATALQAQSATLSGVVHVAGTRGAPAAGVEVTLTPGDRAIRTDSVGRFMLGAIPRGQYMLTARRVGLEATYRVVDLTRVDSVRVELQMQSLAQRMATITVSGRKVTYPARLEDAYQRVSKSTGAFFTAEQIDSLFPLDVSSLLMRVPGVRVSNRIEFARCRELSGSNQRIQVYIDGQRFTRYDGEGGNSVTAAEALRDIVPSRIQLIEIYSGVSRLPVEYLSDACAVILVWMK